MLFCPAPTFLLSSMSRQTRMTRVQGETAMQVLWRTVRNQQKDSTRLKYDICMEDNKAKNGRIRLLSKKLYRGQELDSNLYTYETRPQLGHSKTTEKNQMKNRIK